MSRTVFLTGANGFLGLHILQQLFLHKFNVVAVVRAESKASQVRRIASEFPDQKVSVEFVPDVTVDHAYDKVLAAHPEVTAIIHVASPMDATLTTVDQILDPAINSVLNLARAAKSYAPQVTRFILTSSTAAVLSQTDQMVELFPEGRTTVSEKDWGVAEREELTAPGMLAYSVSKKLAEKALWEFIETEKPNFTATAINPSYLLGENLDKSVEGPAALKGSNAFILGVAAGKFGQQGGKPILHVIDAALAHVEAIDNEKAVGQRWFLSLQIASHAQIIEYAGIVPVTEEGKDFKPIEYIDNKLTLEQFGHPLTNLKVCVQDMVKTMAEHKAF